MCGIVGYIGEEQAFPILIKGLHRLEYRGYDSAGVSLINAKGELSVYKAKGKVSMLEASENIFTTKHISLLCYTKVSEFIILQILSGENDKKSQKNLGSHILLVTL